MEHKHEVGLYIGRFQPFHKGHLSMVLEALDRCDKLIIAIGSAQESGTEKNPFTFELRKELIRRSLWGRGSQCIIIGINDRTEVKDDEGWGEYLIKEVERQTGLTPTINFEGHEEVRSHWFDTVNLERCELNREVIPVSATAVREALLKDDFNTFTKMTGAGLWKFFGRLQKDLLEVKGK
jgi:cytidyltransferase-like protein